MKILPMKLVFITAAFFFFSSSSLHSESMETLLRAFRTQRGIPALNRDELLCECALRYAETLARNGTLSHKDVHGNRAVDRLKLCGGTAFRVGEILGSGGSLSAILSSWTRSSSHVRILEDPSWTHVGIGIAHRGATSVVVVLFIEKAFEDIAVAEQGREVLVTARVLKTETIPLLITLVAEYGASSISEGTVVFRIPANPAPLYMRMGYRTHDGKLVITDSFRFPPIIDRSYNTW